MADSQRTKPRPSSSFSNYQLCKLSTFRGNLLQVNVDTIGHLDHGKTTLAVAITTVLTKTFGGSARSFDQISSTVKKTAHGVVINASHVEYETFTRYYTLFRYSINRFSVAKWRRSHLICHSSAADVDR